MKSLRSLPLTTSLLLFLFPATIHGWGVDGDYTTCKIAQGRFTQAVANAVNALLPKYAEGDLASLCLWVDNVRFQYQWSSALHYIKTPDNLCTYKFKRDYKDVDGVTGRCVSGAINSYTTQLLDYGKQTPQYNLTEALLFFSHLMGDMHQTYSHYMWDLLRTGLGTRSMFIGSQGKLYFIMFGMLA